MRLDHPQISGKYLIIIGLAIRGTAIIPHGSSGAGGGEGRGIPAFNAIISRSKHENTLIHFLQRRFLNL